GRRACPSQIQHEPRRILEHLLHPYQEQHGFAPVDDAVIIAQREVHHGPRLDLSGNYHRPLLDLVHAKDPGLGRVEDRRRHQGAVHPAVADGERAALHLLDLQRALASAATEAGDLALDLRQGFLIAVAYHRYHQPTLAADGDTDVVVIL